MDTKKYIRLQQIIQYHGISRHQVDEWIEFDFFEIHREETDEFIREEELERVERVIRLSRDLGINNPGIDIILRLREELERYRRG